jgi:hypothetical protein
VGSISAVLLSRKIVWVTLDDFLFAEVKCVAAALGTTRSAFTRDALLNRSGLPARAEVGTHAPEKATSAAPFIQGNSAP